MKLIAHRGNTSGKDTENENNPSHIVHAINKGFDAEIDVWFHDGFYSGHDQAQYDIDLDFLLEYRDSLWVHCKNIESLELLSSMNQLNVFWHENDAYTLTSKGFIWTYPHRKVCKKSIIVCNNSKYAKYQNCFGVCSDYLS